jgi:uncharacterized FAD-dependent dehydrogenase
MSLRLANLHLPIDAPEDELPGRVAALLGLAPTALTRWRILRKSLDARDKALLQFVYSVEVVLGEDEDHVLSAAQKRLPAGVRLDRYEEQPFAFPPPGTCLLSHRPIVVGAGPGGMAAAYFLAEQGYQPILLERGRQVRERIQDVRAFDDGAPHNPESNYLFGEGGAGTFSDGKLTYRGTGPDVFRILQFFAECKGKPSVVYEARPHLGSNRLPAVVKAMRQRIERRGGEVRFSCRVEDLDVREGQVAGVHTSSGYLPASVVVLAPGHSARDTYEMLVRRGVQLAPKPFQMGVRIEQPQENVNRHTYGAAKLEQRLGAASYELVARGAVNLFTFCMCAGGYIMPSVSEPGAFCTNGMSLSRHDSPYANSGLVVTIPVENFPSSDVLAGIRLQQQYERAAAQAGKGEYLCPIQRARDYLAERPARDVPASSYPRGGVAHPIAELIPPLVREALQQGLPILDRQWAGKFLLDATLVGPESRGSSPVRIVREDVSRHSPGVAGLYPVGEGAGYAGGIISAALDGLRTAAAIVALYARLAEPIYLPADVGE